MSQYVRARISLRAKRELFLKLVLNFESLVRFPLSLSLLLLIKNHLLHLSLSFSSRLIYISLSPYITHGSTKWAPSCKFLETRTSLGGRAATETTGSKFVVNHHAVVGAGVDTWSLGVADFQQFSQQSNH